MKLLEIYAATTGVKIPKDPVAPYSKFFPLPGKYITLQNSSGMKSKDYSYYQQAIDLIKPILDENDIKIVQIGGGGDEKINGTRTYCGITDFHQSSYVVKNALLHVGNDSVWCHVAGQYGVPVVELFGPTLANVCAPYHSHCESVLIESHRNGRRPSHTAEESPRTIDFIKPEEVAAAILKVLKIEEEIQFKTVYIGGKYKIPQIQLVPENISYPEFNLPLIARMDIIHDQYSLAKILSSNACEIKTNKSFSKEILLNFKSKIFSVIYEINNLEDCDLSFIDTLNKGIKFAVTSKLKGEELGALKMKLFDSCIVSPEREFEKWNKGGYKGLRVKTNTKLFFGGKFYASDYHFKKNIPIEGDVFSLEEDLDSEDFINATPNFYIYET